MAEEIIKAEETATPAPVGTTPEEAQEAEDINLKVAKLETQLSQAGHVIESLKKAKKKQVDVSDEILNESSEERQERLRQIAREEIEAIQASTRETLIQQQSEVIAKSQTQLAELKKALASRRTLTTGGGGGQKPKEPEPTITVEDTQLVNMMAKSGFAPDGKGGWAKVKK